MSYPTTRTERQARRAAIRAQLIAAAEARAREAGRSLVCAFGSGKHPSSCVGVTGCLCECHDPSEGA